MKIRAVLFDYGNTLALCYKKDAFASVLEQCVLNAIDYLRPHGLYYEPDVILESAWQYNIEREDLVVTPIEQRLTALFSLAPSFHPMLPGLVEAFMAPNISSAKKMPGSDETLEAIKQRGLTTGIISNLPWGCPAEPWTRQLETMGLKQYFDHITYCMDIGVRKPHPEIFKRALAKSGVEAKQALFVGDDPVWDVTGAQEMGMPVLLFDPEHVVKRDDIPVISKLTEVLDYLD